MISEDRFRHLRDEVLGRAPEILGRHEMDPSTALLRELFFRVRDESGVRGEPPAATATSFGGQPSGPNAYRRAIGELLRGRTGAEFNYNRYVDELLEQVLGASED